MKLNIPAIPVNEIEAVIFDFGGVILDINISETINAFAGLKIEGLSEKDIIAEDRPYFLNLELGLITPTQFIEAIRKEYPASEKVPEAAVWAAWNALLQPYDKEKINVLRELSKEYRIYLLSNTNYPHRVKFEEMFREQFGYELQDLFIHCYYSDEMHLRKPDPEIYQQVTDDIGINPGKIVFIDDKEINIAAAKACGWHTCHLANGLQITDLFVI